VLWGLRVCYLVQVIVNWDVKEECTRDLPEGVCQRRRASFEMALSGSAWVSWEQQGWLEQSVKRSPKCPQGNLLGPVGLGWVCGSDSGWYGISMKGLSRDALWSDLVFSRIAPAAMERIHLGGGAMGCGEKRNGLIGYSKNLGLKQLCWIKTVGQIVFISNKISGSSLEIIYC
jgi:hypothetical protein